VQSCSVLLLDSRCRPTVRKKKYNHTAAVCSASRNTRTRAPTYRRPVVCIVCIDCACVSELARLCVCVCVCMCVCECAACVYGVPCVCECEPYCPGAVCVRVCRVRPCPSRTSVVSVACVPQTF